MTTYYPNGEYLYIKNNNFFNTISSDDGRHIAVVQEFQRPMHSGFAIYRKIFPNIYKCEYLYDVKAGYLPFESGGCTYE
jgi:hypothetical protein